MLDCVTQIYMTIDGSPEPQEKQNHTYETVSHEMKARKLRLNPDKFYKVYTKTKNANYAV